MTVEFRERNIDKEYGIVFEITKDGKTEKVSLFDIAAQSTSGNSLSLVTTLLVSVLLVTKILLIFVER